MCSYAKSTTHHANPISQNFLLRRGTCNNGFIACRADCNETLAVSGCPSVIRVVKCCPVNDCSVLVKLRNCLFVSPVRGVFFIF